MTERITTRPRAGRIRASQPRPRGKHLSLQRMLPLLVAAGVLVVIGLVLMVLAVRSSGRPTVELADHVPLAATAKVSTAVGTVEVPGVAGGSLADAQLVLDTAGFKVAVSYEEQAAGRAGMVLAQDPAPGVLAAAGSPVRIVVSGARNGAPAQVAATAPVAAPVRQLVVVIDPGHQSRSDQSLEPVGPGSTSKKAKVSGGATGVATKVAEYEIALQISTNLAARLRKAGVKVVMTRTTNDVNLSNVERAAIANRAKADLFVRIHANSSPDPKRAGMSTLYPAANRWAKKHSLVSKRAAMKVQAAALASTGAADDGVEPRGDLAGFNYAKVPSVLVECGFLSNPVEDRLLASPHYQDKIAQGIADGVLAYLGSTQ